MARILLGVTGGIAAYKSLEFTRLATAHEELAAQGEFPHVVINDRLDDAVEALEEVVRTSLGSEGRIPRKDVP